MTKLEVFKFISYAVWWIRQSILQALAEQSRLIRLPLNKVGLSNKINKSAHQLEQEFEREPSAQELSIMLDISEEEIQNTLNHHSRHLSLDAPMAEGEDMYLVDVMANPNSVNTDADLDHNQSLKIEIERALSVLTPRQADVLKMFFGLANGNPMSLEDIGLEFELTRERVRQIKDKALLKLRTASKGRTLKDFLGG